MTRVVPNSIVSDRLDIRRGVGAPQRGRGKLDRGKGKGGKGREGRKGNGKGKGCPVFLQNTVGNSRSPHQKWVGTSSLQRCRLLPNYFGLVIVII